MGYSARSKLTLYIQLFWQFFVPHSTWICVTLAAIVDIRPVDLFWVEDYSVVACQFSRCPVIRVYLKAWTLFFHVSFLLLQFCQFYFFLKYLHKHDTALCHKKKSPNQNQNISCFFFLDKTLFYWLMNDEHVHPEWRQSSPTACDKIP